MTADLHTLSGAYALDALPADEAREFTRHLAVCESCAVEVAELRETAARLALAVAEVPPPELRARVMAALPGVRQLPPAVRVAPAAPRPAWLRKLPRLALAACLAGAVVAGGAAVVAEHDAAAQRGRIEQQASQLAALVASPDAVFRAGTLHGGGRATVVTSASLARGALLYEDLPTLPGGRVYELWYGHDGAMVPAGLIGSGHRSGTALLSGTASGADAVGVTVEPAGGSPKPTTTPLMLVSIAS